MSIAKSFGNLLAVAIVIGCVYAFLNWESIDPAADDIGEYAKRACADEIASRYDSQSANIYAVDKTNKGYVVRASMTLTRGTPVKVTCLANEHGRIEEVRVDER